MRHVGVITQRVRGQEAASCGIKQHAQGAHRTMQGAAAPQRPPHTHSSRWRAQPQAVATTPLEPQEGRCPSLLSC